MSVDTTISASEGYEKIDSANLVQVKSNTFLFEDAQIVFGFENLSKSGKLRKNE